MQGKQGVLYIVSTPIGNLEDITFRAVRILNEVDIIASEDTRHTRILLNHYQIKTPTTSFHKFNEKNKIPYLINLMQSGKNIALVSDAGTPGISDPGYEIIHHAILQNIPIICIPGPVALISGLVVSGFSTQKFVFEGFLPSKAQSRRHELNSIKDENRTIIFYESPHRLKDLLKDIYDILGDRACILAREITKKFEEILRGNISEILALLPENIKGEFTVVVDGKKKEANKLISLTPNQIKTEVEKIIQQKNISKNEAIKELIELTGISRKEIYKACISEG